MGETTFERSIPGMSIMSLDGSESLKTVYLTCPVVPMSTLSPSPTTLTYSTAIFSPESGFASSAACVSALSASPVPIVPVDAQPVTAKAPPSTIAKRACLNRTSLKLILRPPFMLLPENRTPGSGLLNLLLQLQLDVLCRLYLAVLVPRVLAYQHALGMYLYNLAISGPQHIPAPYDIPLAVRSLYESEAFAVAHADDCCQDLERADLAALERPFYLLGRARDGLHEDDMALEGVPELRALGASGNPGGQVR